MFEQRTLSKGLSAVLFTRHRHRSYVYILKLDRKLRMYVGQTRNLLRRVRDHLDGKTNTTAGVDQGIYVLYDVYNAGTDALRDPPSPNLALYVNRSLIDPIPVSSHQTIVESGRLRYMVALSTDGLKSGTYLLAAILPVPGPEKPIIHRWFQIVDWIRFSYS